MIIAQPHILLIEDNSADSHLVRKCFEQCCKEASMVVVTDGREGIEYLNKKGKFGAAQTPHLVLLDLNLPGADGQEVLREIKSDPKLRSIPIVVFTSSGAESDIRRCYDSGVNAYYTKPSELDQFIGLIEFIYEHWFKRVKLPVLAR